MRQIAIFVLLAAAAMPLAAAKTTDRVVLGNGKVIENVTARVEDGMVWLTFEGGRMQAYSVEDVDLAASGLLDEPKAVAEGDISPVATAPSMAAAAEKSAESRTEDSIKITDADVEHILPEEEPAEDAEEDGEQRPKPPLEVTNLSHSLLGEHTSVKGIVTNHTEEPMQGVKVVVHAKTEDGVIVASGNTAIVEEIGPHSSAQFTLVLTGSKDFETLEGRAQMPASRARSRRPPEGRSTTSRPPPARRR